MYKWAVPGDSIPPTKTDAGKACGRCIFTCPMLLKLLLTLGGRVGLPPNDDRDPSYAFADTGETTLGKAIAADLERHPGLSGFYLLPRGVDAFTARAALAYRAERSIDAQYYLLHNDLVGKLFLDSLLKAADRGVRVRLLVDDMALDDRKDVGAAALDAHPNFEIRIFNPFGRGGVRWWQFLSRFGDVTRRMHNKSFTVDNQVTVVGGRNIGNEYFEANPELQFGDLDVLGVGPVVGEVSSVFDLYWNSASSYPVGKLVKKLPDQQKLDELDRSFGEFIAQQLDSVYLQALYASPLLELIRDWSFDFHWGESDVLYDDPAKITSARDQHHLRLNTQLQTYSAEIEHELLIFSPYFVPGSEGVENLSRMVKRGVRVRIITNSLASTDVAAVHAGYARYRKPLLRAGVELYEVDKTLTRDERKEIKGPSGSSKASLHAKSFVVDRQRVFIGSLNLDPRSVVENTEIGIMIESPEMARLMGEGFDRIVDGATFRVALEDLGTAGEALRWYRQSSNGQQVFSNEPNTGFWRRLGVSLLRLLPIESQL